MAPTRVGGVIGWCRVFMAFCSMLVMSATIYWFTESHRVLLATQLRQQLNDLQRPPSTPRHPHRQLDGETNTTKDAASARTTTVEEDWQHLSSREMLELQATSEHNKYGRPALRTILDNAAVIGDPSWLLDFGIIGYGKCGTSTMMIWLKDHPQVQAFDHELQELMVRRPDALIRRLYTELQPGPYQRGYKAPQDINQQHIMDYYRQYWPSAKLIVGIRHPVKWMESLYNFRVQNLERDKVMPHPNKLIGNCQRGSFHTCTHKGDFAFSLMKLGKQNHPVANRSDGVLEQRIIGRYPLAKHRYKSSIVPPMANPLFLFDLSQLGDSNATRTDVFRRDFTAFMGLNETLPPIPHRVPGRMRNGDDQERRNRLKIDICDHEYAPLRRRLLEHAIDASLFIRTYLLKNPTVVVSSPDHFEEIMRQWMVDPCASGTAMPSITTDHAASVSTNQ